MSKNVVAVLLVLGATAPSLRARDDQKLELSIYSWVSEQGRRVEYEGQIGFDPREIENLFLFLRYRDRLFKAVKAYYDPRTRKVAGSFTLDSALAVGDWEVLLMARRKDGSETQATYLMLVGDAGDVTARQAAEAKRLLDRVEQIQETFNALTGSYKDFKNKDWTEVAGKWLELRRDHFPRMRLIHQFSLRERGKVLAPLFPRVQEITEQMAIKIMNLHANLGHLLKGSTAGRTQVQAIADGLTRSIPFNLDMARKLLTETKITGLLGLYREAQRLEAHHQQLASFYRRSLTGSGFDGSSWKAFSHQWRQGLILFRDRARRFRNTSLAAENEGMNPAFDSFFENIEKMWAACTVKLYSTHGVSPRHRIDVPKALLGDKQLPRLEKRVREALAVLKSIIARDRAVVSRHLKAHWEKTRVLLKRVSHYLGLFHRYAGSYHLKVYPDEVMRSWSSDHADIERVSGQLADEKYYADYRYYTYFPQLSRSLPAVASLIRSLLYWLDKEFRGEKEVEKLRGKIIKFDRVARITGFEEGLAGVVKELARPLRNLEG